MQSIKEFMLKDHERLHSIFMGEFIPKKWSRDLERVTTIFNRFKHGLEQHIIWEEEILFPLFEEKNNSDNITKGLRRDHKNIKRILLKINEVLKERNINKIEHFLEQDLCNYLDPHNKQEEHSFYPELDNILKKKEKVEVLAKIRE